MDASLFRRVEFPADVQPGPLAPLAAAAAERLRAAKQKVTVFEATTAGLIQAALQAVPGASSYTTCGAVTYSTSQASALLGADLSAPRPADGEAYRQSKSAWTQMLARRMRKAIGATWCVCESGACGLTFNYPDVSSGFTSIFVSGPIERGITVESPHNKREENMWAFTKLALDLLAECVAEASALLPAADSAGAGAGEATETFAALDDRYGGVEVAVSADTLASPSAPSSAQFGRELARALEDWRARGKQGVWLKVPDSQAHFVGPAIALGFQFHHALPGYVQLTRWMPEGLPSPLPNYGFTQIGVGGVVVNTKGEVLMVKERVSPLPMFQGQWKLPGGLADPGEDFAATVAREVREETGVVGTLEGLVSLRHSHGFRFGQGDIYVLVRLRADADIIKIDPHELLDAQWMSRENIQAALVPSADYKGSMEGLVSPNNWKMICNALDGSLIEGTTMPNSRGGPPSMLYTAREMGEAT
mmetsp:Transcript_92973/g.299229  ORF Transcript_92973/g.299229 Transcript_92973/m.299229 type:complete len:477 (+) Transcript_92973:117-1547(+)